MDNSELQRVSRPPATAIAISILWGLGGCSELLIWVVKREAFYLLVAFVAVVFMMLILKGVGWFFWANLALISLSLGVTLLQIQIPIWAYGTPSVFLWLRAFIAADAIVLHQFASLQRWFGIRKRGKRWQVVFWLLVAGLTTLGQYILPTIKALRQ